MKSALCDEVLPWAYPTTIALRAPAIDTAPETEPSFQGPALMCARERQIPGKLVDITFVILGVRRTTGPDFAVSGGTELMLITSLRRTACSWAAVRAARRPWRPVSGMRVGSIGIGATAAGMNRAHLYFPVGVPLLKRARQRSTTEQTLAPPLCGAEARHSPADRRRARQEGL
jgi:hypothetical protein